jgi:hypothetical protein
MKVSEIENKITDKIAYLVLFIGIGLLIYSRWGQWLPWLSEVSFLILITALSCGLVCTLIFALLYRAEGKKRERLEQEIQELKNQLGKED